MAEVRPLGAGNWKMKGLKAAASELGRIMQGGEVKNEEEWKLEYPPTTEILKRGTNPSGEVPEDKKLPPLRDPAPHLEITQ